MLGNPEIEAEGPYAVVLAPTRELAQQASVLLVPTVALLACLLAARWLVLAGQCRTEPFPTALLDPHFFPYCVPFPLPTD